MESGVNGDSERVREIEVKGKEKETEHVKDEEETMRRAKGVKGEDERVIRGRDR